MAFADNPLFRDLPERNFTAPSWVPDYFTNENLNGAGMRAPDLGRPQDPGLPALVGQTPFPTIGAASIPAQSAATNENFFPSLGTASDIGNPAASFDLSNANLFSQPSVDSNTGQIAQPVSQPAVDAAASTIGTGAGDIQGMTTSPDTTAQTSLMGGVLSAIINGLFPNLLPTSTPNATATSPDQAPISGSSFFQNVFNITGNFFTRAGLVLLAIIIVAIGLWAMLSKSKIGVTIRENAGKAAAMA